MAKTLQAFGEEFNKLVNTAGSAGLHYLFPNEFEIYFVAFELVNSDGDSVEYLLFPINPESISISEPQNVSIKKTAGGISTIVNPTFQPIDITCIGTFGKRFRLVQNGTGSFFGTAYRRTKERIKNFKNNIQENGFKNAIFKGDPSKDREFSDSIKTGYGVCKILEKLFELSRSVDEKGRPYYMFFYNLSFNQQYIVEPITLNFTQDVQTNNMFWRYNFTIKAVGEARLFRSESENRAGKSLKEQLISAVEYKAAVGLSNIVRRTLKIL